MITKKGGHVKRIARELENTRDIKKAIMEQSKGKVDFIKVIISGGLLTEPRITELSNSFIRIVVNEASKIGLRTAAHVYSEKDVEAAVQAGVWSIEHASWASRASLKRAASRGIFLVPTLKAFNSIIENSDTLPNHIVKNAYEALRASRRTIPLALKEKVCIAMGTDAGTPCNYHGDNAMELEYMSDIGMSNQEIIEAATVNAAKLLGKKYLGKVKPGFVADLLLLDSNPMDDIRVFRKGIKCVIKNGQIIKAGSSL
jgi:imidazolonepropionase-like amidohydrolase